MNNPNCRLCLINPADKKNSHIIPKFLCKSLFEFTQPRHAVRYNKDLKGTKVQDTPKENNILCSSCEKRIEILETYFARVIEDIHSYKTLPQKFELSKLGIQHYIRCKDLNPVLYKLFLYSLVWRASISNLDEYKPFELEKIHEEIIREFLNNSLASTQSELFQNIASVSTIPCYHNCIIKPKDKVRGVFSIASISKSAHALFLMDFAIFFYTDEASIGDVLINYSNKENKDVIIALSDLPAWNQLNQLFVTKMVDSKKGSN